MEPDFEVFEEYITEVQNYRKNYFDDISIRCTDNGSQDFFIDVKTLNVISFKVAEPRIPCFGTLTSYFCEPARKIIEELSSCQEKVKTTSQKEPLEWGMDSGIGTNTSGITESSQESFTSSDEECEFPFRGHDSKVSEDLDSCQKMSICDLSIREHNSKVYEKDRDSSLKKSKWDLSIGKHNSKVYEKDRDSSLKKSKWGNKKPNPISVRRNPAFNRDTSFLRNIPVDDFSISSSLSKSSNSINCSSKQSSSIYYVKNGQTGQEQKTPQKNKNRRQKQKTKKTK